MSPSLAGALVGFGGVAERGHLPGYRRDPRFAIRAVCDPDRGARERARRALGDEVSDWILFNEPSVFTALGYLLGTHAPGRRDLDAFLRASHVVNLAQGEACRALRAWASPRSRAPSPRARCLPQKRTPPRRASASSTRRW